MCCGFQWVPAWHEWHNKTSQYKQFAAHKSICIFLNPFSVQLQRQSPEFLITQICCQKDIWTIERGQSWRTGDRLVRQVFRMIKVDTVVMEYVMMFIMMMTLMMMKTMLTGTRAKIQNTTRPAHLLFCYNLSRRLVPVINLLLVYSFYCVGVINLRSNIVNTKY